MNSACLLNYPIKQGSCFKAGANAILALILILFLSSCSLLHRENEDEMYARKNPCVILALPGSGPYAPIATKIKKGAAEAQQELKAEGVNLRLENVNTETPNWLQTIDSLPPMCAVVGGPLRDKEYSAARKAGLLQKRAFFSFVPTLEKGDEGTLAWRFFPGPQDQIDALVNFVSNDLNIRTFGSFYPQDSYGPRMSALLEQSLAKKHINLHKASYNPSAPATWSSSVKPLIQPVNAGGVPVPQTPFEALFLPDSWKHLDMLLTSLMYNGEDRLVLLGTNLWEQGVSGKKISHPEKYALAVFPGVWNQTSAPKSLQKPGNDFWTALGYDFVNFAVGTGIIKRLESPEITKRAQTASGRIRAIAPISWDANGIAKERLYLYQIGPNGMKPLNIELFKKQRAAALEQAALRMQGISSSASASEEREPDVDAPVKEEPEQPVIRRTQVEDDVEETTEAPVQAKPAVSAPVLPQGQIMSPVPQPSYKLRLPTKRAN